MQAKRLSAQTSVASGGLDGRRAASLQASGVADRQTRPVLPRRAPSAGGPASSRRSSSYQPSLVGGLAVEEAGQAARRSGRGAGALDGGAQHVASMSGAAARAEARVSRSARDRWARVGMTGYVRRRRGACPASLTPRAGRHERRRHCTASAAKETMQGDVERQAEHVDHDGERDRPQQRRRAGSARTGGAGSRARRAGAACRSRAVVVQIAGAPRWCSSAVSSRPSVAKRRHWSLMPEPRRSSASCARAKYSTSEKKRSSPESLPAGQPHVEVEPVLARVVLDLRPPAAAVEEVAEKAVEVGRDRFDVWTLRHSPHGRLYPSLRSSAGDLRELRCLPGVRTNTVECVAREVKRTAGVRRASGRELP